MMGYDLNTSEATAGLAALLERATKGPLSVRFGRRMTITGNVHQVLDGDDYPTAFVPAWDNPEPGEIDGTDEAIANAALIARAPDLASEVLRLSATVADLTAANAALAADNARLGKRVEDAFREGFNSYETACSPQTPEECAWEKSKARAYLAGGE